MIFLAACVSCVLNKYDCMVCPACLAETIDSEPDDPAYHTNDMPVEVSLSCSHARVGAGLLLSDKDARMC